MAPSEAISTRSLTSQTLILTDRKSRGSVQVAGGIAREEERAGARETASGELLKCA